MITEKQYEEFIRMVYKSIQQNQDAYDGYKEKNDMENANYYLGKIDELNAVIGTLTHMEFEND